MLYSLSILFQLTRLMRGVTMQKDKRTELLLFQLTRLMRGVTSPATPAVSWVKFQLTRLMRGVTEDPHDKEAPK